METKSIEQQLAEIEEYCGKATEGPWEAQIPAMTGEWPTAKVKPLKIQGKIYNHPVIKTADAEFIASARTDLPTLCKLVRELIERERWIPCTERMPEAYVEVLVKLVNGRITSGHLETNGRGDIITRPLTAPGEVVRQWPAWEVGDPENYHEATHWRKITPPHTGD